VRVGGGEDEGADFGQVEPEGKFAADNAAGLAGAAAGDDFDAAQMVGVRGMQEAAQRLVGGLGGLSVQIQRAGGGELAAAKAVPGGFV
jgi:hypothetical protein